MEYVVEKPSNRTKEIVTRCRDCRFLGRETPVAGEYRCNRTERMTTLDDYCSKAVRRDG